MEKIKEILKNLEKELELEENIKLRVVPMKFKIASISLKKNILRLNKNVIKELNDEEIRYILLHELIHLKIKDVNHGSLFLDELQKYMDIKKIWNIEIGIIEKIFQASDN